MLEIWLMPHCHSYMRNQVIYELYHVDWLIQKSDWPTDNITKEPEGCQHNKLPIITFICVSKNLSKVFCSSLQGLVSKLAAECRHYTIPPGLHRYYSEMLSAQKDYIIYVLR